MRITLLLVVFILLGGSSAAQPPSQAPKKMEELIGEARGRLGGVLETKDFQEKMTFAKFLRMLEKGISKEKKFSIEFDREAFGKDADNILNAEVSLPKVPARLTFFTALRLALAQAHEERQEIEFTARPGALVITTRDRSLFTATYEIGDLLKHVRYLHDSIPWPADVDAKADPGKPDEWIVRQLIALTDGARAGWRNRTPASTLRVVNGTQLLVHAAPSVHEEIGQTLSVLRRLTDLFVVMNAKVYALDRAEYDAHFAASFVDPKDKSTWLATTITDAQWKRLQARKPILESDADKLRPTMRAVFLAQKNGYQYQASPGDANPTTAFEGFSFAVRPIVSPDRRCIRLELFHDVEQLVKLTKGTMIDLKTGKELPIELPNVRKSTQTGTLDIHDGQPIMLNVDYRPDKDRVWLLLAEPRIYMEEEEEYLRKSAIKRMPLADEKPAPPDQAEQLLDALKALPAAPAPIQLPDQDDVTQILQAIVESVLTDREVKGHHDVYGTPGDQKFALDNEGHVLWPKAFRPAIAGFAEERLQPGQCRSFRPRLMGIRIFDFDLKELKAGKEVSIVLELHNVGGYVNGGVSDHHVLVYSAKREGKRWMVRCTLE